MRYRYIFLLLLTTLLFLSSIQKRKSCTLHFNVFCNDRLVLLDNTNPYVNSSGDTFTINNLKLYLCDFKLYFEDGSFWKDKQSAHLIDLEKPETQRWIWDKIPAAKSRYLEFTIGVDSLYNTNGAMKGDLDPTKGMFWAWNSGYINFKIEGVSKSCQTHKNKFEFHIGGYRAPDATCRRIKLPVLNSTNGLTIICRLDSVFNHLSLIKHNQIQSPGAEASGIADLFAKGFTVESIR